METKVLNYRIIVEPETHEKTGKVVYVSYCPKLGVSDWGRTVEQAIAHIREAIECHLESLVKHGEDIPQPDTDEYVIATARVNAPPGVRLSFA